MPPQCAELLLAADIPNSERDVLILQRLHIEANRRHRALRLPELQSIEYGRLAGVVEAKHEDAHLPLHDPIDNPARELRDQPVLLQRIFELALVVLIAEDHLRVRVDRCGGLRRLAAVNLAAIEPRALGCRPSLPVRLGGSAPS